MKIPHRRQFLHLAAGAAALPAISQIAQAQAYPTRPVRVIVAAPAGGVTDIVARLLAQYLSGRLGQQFIVDNRPGGSNNIGTEAVVRARPDGYTLLLANGLNSINASLFEKLPYNFIRDTAPVAAIADSPLLILVNPSLPATTVPEFIAYAKANPGKINMASGGAGSPDRDAGELFKMMTGIDMLHVPYTGASPALAGLIGDQVQVYFGTVGSSIEYVKAGTLRALAVGSASRLQVLPDTPTVSDFLPGFEAGLWLGLCGPKNLPSEIVEKLNREINSGLADSKLRARLAELGLTILSGSPAEFGRLIVEDTEKWAKVIRAAGIKAE
jgi:tripartite-type tricarboxylate transporter receptor subunit TctC